MSARGHRLERSVPWRPAKEKQCSADYAYTRDLGYAGAVARTEDAAIPYSGHGGVGGMEAGAADQNPRAMRTAREGHDDRGSLREAVPGGAPGSGSAKSRGKAMNASSR